MTRPPRRRYRCRDSDPVLLLLRAKPQSIADVAAALEANPGNTCRRLHRLHEMGLVKIIARDGRRILWSAEAQMDGTTE